MAWEWVAPTATGTVALAGIAATYLTGREARRSAEQLANSDRLFDRANRNRDERRAAYAELLAACDACTVANTDGFLLARAAKKDYGALLRHYTRHTARVGSAQAAVTIWGSPSVQESATAFAAYVVRRLEQAQDGQVPTGDGTPRANYVRAVRDDLAEGSSDAFD